jgi:hypothetical protein
MRQFETRRHFALAIVAGALSLTLSGCVHSKPAEGGAVKAMKASDLDVMRKAPGSKVVVFDVNAAEYRAKHGAIPGAVLLADHKSYDLGALPSAKDTPLVFYCTSWL